MPLPVRRGDGDHARRGPLAELERLNRQFEQYLDWPELHSLMPDVFTPLADVEETDDAYVVEIDLAGVNKDDVDVELAGRRLTVTGERKERERVGILRKRTRTVGRFHYEVVLPGEVEDDGVEANLAEGVLSVRVPKPANARPRRITVS